MDEFGHTGIIGNGFCIDAWGNNHFRIIVNGKEYFFEDSDRFGPSLHRKDGELRKNPWPHEKHPFWQAHSQWRKQGRRLAEDKMTCIYDPIRLPTCTVKNGKITIVEEGDPDCYELLDITDPKNPRIIVL